MDINGLRSSEIFTQLQGLAGSDMAEAIKSKVQDAIQEKVSGGILGDEIDLGSFDSVKELIAEVKDSKRSGLVDQLREKFLSGDLDFSSGQIADAMMSDGSLEALLI